MLCKDLLRTLWTYFEHCGLRKALNFERKVLGVLRPKSLQFNAQPSVTLSYIARWN